MAFISQQDKARLSPRIKAVLAKYGLKGTLSIRDHRTLALNVKAGAIDFIGSLNADRFFENPHNLTHVSVNPYWYHEHFNGKARQALSELIAAMNDGNHDNTDIGTDYFDVGWYVDINVGRWNQPYELLGEK